MYIETVRIRNLRCFKDVTLDLRSTQGPKKLAVVVGDNGAGKTTLLRAIAMGLCDKDGTSGLLRDTTGNLIRQGADTATIRIDLKQAAKRYTITTTFAKSRAGFETVRNQVTRPSKNFPWRGIFVCGYGANRGTEGASDTERYSAADAVYTLFSYDWQLLNPEVVLWRRTQGNKDRLKKICRAMDQILMLPNGSTRLNKKGLRVSDTRRFVAGVGAMADGYAGTLAWVLDMLGWWFVAHPNVAGRSPKGIVLIDEIEQHLHPKWQRGIIHRLHEQFPHVQIIATTHSPLCAASTPDIGDYASALLLLDQSRDGPVELVDDLPPVGGLRSDQILASRVFGYIVEGNVGTENLLREISMLADKGRRRDSAEDKRYEQLRGKLRDVVIRDRRTAIEEEMEEELDKTIRNRIRTLEKKLFRDA
jgi:predicted ATPase